MTEVVLFLVITVLCGLIGWDRHESRKERQKMIQAIMSKTAQDLKDFELAEKLNISLPVDPTLNDDFKAVEDLNDKEINQYILDKEPNG